MGLLDLLITRKEAEPVQDDGVFLDLLIVSARDFARIHEQTRLEIETMNSLFLRYNRMCYYMQQTQRNEINITHNIDAHYIKRDNNIILKSS